MTYRPIFGAAMPFFLLYCALLGVGIWLLTVGAAPSVVRVTAVKAMALNHVVQPGDLAAMGNGPERAAGDAAIAGLQGRYAHLSIDAGQVLDALDFGATPLLVGAPNMVMIGLPVTGAAGNAGAVFHVCKPAGDGQSETPVTAFAASAVLCADKARATCVAVANLTPGDARTLVAAMPGAELLPAKTAACVAKRSRPNSSSSGTDSETP